MVVLGRRIARDDRERGAKPSPPVRTRLELKSKRNTVAMSGAACAYQAAVNWHRCQGGGCSNNIEEVWRGLGWRGRRFLAYSDSAEAHV